jgi:hypothetical protein
MRNRDLYAIEECAEIALASNEQKMTVRGEMERILHSEFFRSSPRSSQFLRFVVEHTLDGCQEQLKERLIGIEVFGRKPSYPTEGDAVVRVRATDVRKRLSQYYANLQQSSACRIEIPPGSYIPQFLAWDGTVPEIEAVPGGEAVVSEPPAPHPRAKRVRLPLGIAALLVVIPAVVLGIYRLSAGRRVQAHADANEMQLEQFWQPALRDPKSVLICIGSPTTYTYSGSFQGNYVREHRIDPNRQPQWTIDPQKGTIPGNVIIPVRSEYVGAGDADLAALLSALFGRLGKPSELRLSDDTSYSDISDEPTVLIGAFTNRWTLQSVRGEPFFFAQEGPERLIEERDGQHRHWTPPHLRADGKTGLDFALISRLVDSDTGKFLVTAAGISGFGSRAAGYFLTRPDLLARALNQAPPDWARKNLQFVLETRIVDNAPTAPEVIAWRTW